MDRDVVLNNHILLLFFFFLSISSSKVEPPWEVFFFFFFVQKALEIYFELPVYFTPLDAFQSFCQYKAMLVCVSG